MTSREIIFARFDPNGMIGRSVPGVAGEEGNPWTELATAMLALHLDGEISTQEIESVLLPLYEKLKVPGMPGLVNHKFNDVGVVSPDEVTFDDIIGFVLLCVLSNRLDILVELIDTGEKRGWILSNTGKTYFTAIARPWHIASYKLSASPKVKPSVWSNALLASYFLFRGIFRSSPSGIRLDRLMAASVKGKSLIVDLALMAWRPLVLRDYKTFSRVLVSYYNDENHFIAKVFPE